MNMLEHVGLSCASVPDAFAYIDDEQQYAATSLSNSP